jgi:3-oxoacyl-[acyl-carrier protein] reductase
MKNAIVLGASGETGKAIIDLLLKLEYNLIGTYYSKEPQEIKGVEFFHLDMSSISSINNLLNVLKTKENIDLLVNTISKKPTFNRLEKISFEDYKQEMDVNCLNFIYLIQKLLGGLINQDKSSKFNKNSNIINILTEFVIGPVKYVSPYITSKYAMLGFMQTLSAELKDKEIYVNSISPGMMETKFLSNLPSFVKAKYLANHDGFTKPSEVVEVIKKIIQVPQTGKNIGVFNKKNVRN